MLQAKVVKKEAQLLKTKDRILLMTDEIEQVSMHVFWGNITTGLYPMFTDDLTIQEGFVKSVVYDCSKL